MEVMLKCVVVDDEPLARGVLEKYIEVVDYLNLVATAENPVELNDILEKEAIDLIFLDIEMPIMNGLDFLKIKTNLPYVIVTTAYPNHALDGFQLGVIDYLVKPITFNWFFKAVGKVYEYHRLKNNVLNSDTLTNVEDYFFVKCENKYQKIFTQKILYIQSLQNYVMIQTESDKHVSLMPLKTIEENLDQNQFIRVHKSYLVNKNKITILENHQLQIGDHSIPISRGHRKLSTEKILANKVVKKEN